MKVLGTQIRLVTIRLSGVIGIFACILYFNFWHIAKRHVRGGYLGDMKGVELGDIIHEGPKMAKMSPFAIEFRTNIPMYYINLDRSVERRLVMEKSFGRAGDLMRVPAFEKGKLDEYLSLTGVKNVEEYKKETGATTGEISLVLSHLHAIKQAYVNGSEIAMILEDDMSLMLVPFWRHTPDQIVEGVTEEWDIIRLQYSVPGADVWKLFTKWRSDPHVLLYRTNDFYVGAGAYIVSRSGMEKMLDIYMNGQGQFDCLRRRENVKCIADKLLFKSNHSFLAMPPLIVPRLYKSATGVRDWADDDISKHQEIVDSLHWVMQDFEMRTSGSATALEVPQGPLTRWAVVSDVNSAYFIVLRILVYLGISGT